jgi:8-oxo-dGTP diphosphatase
MPNKLVDVAAGIIYKQDKILLCRRKEGKQQAGFWEFPGGKIEISESKENALLREIKEELGIEIRVTGFIAQSIYHYPRVSICLWAYACKYISGEINLTDHDKIEWVTPISLSNYTLSPADVAIAERISRPEE